MNTLSSFNGSSVLDGSRNVVTKIGGENSSHIFENLQSAKARIDAGQRVALVVSAMRNPESSFNTTSMLNEVGELISTGCITHALMTLDRISELTREQISMNGFDGNLPVTLRDEFIQSLHAVVRRETKILSEDHIAPGGAHNITRDGGDYIFENHTVFSITGWGEHLAQKVYEEAARVFGIAVARFPSEAFAESMYQTLEGPIGAYTDHLRQELFQTLRNVQFPLHRFTVLPGHFPKLARTRGYSDTGAALTAQVVKNFEIESTTNDTTCLFRKQYPLMDSDPRAKGGSAARIIHYASYDDLQQFVRPDGIAPGVIHPPAVEMLAEKKIPTVLSSLADERTGDNTLIM